MPKRKPSTTSTKATKTIKIVFAVVALFFLMAAGVLGYHAINRQTFAFPLPNGQHIGFRFDDQGQARVELGWFGCCSPYCEEMYEIECSQEYGLGGQFHLEYCTRVPSCDQGCCLPDCHMTSKSLCEGDFGVGGDGWQPQTCTQLPQCDLGCCLLDGGKFPEAKTACESAGGAWSAGACQTGFSATLEGSGSKDIGGGVILSQHHTYQLYTCGTDINSIWQGKGTVTTSSQGKGIAKSDTDSDYVIPINFEADQGSFAYTETHGGKISYSGQVTDSQMSLTFEAAGILDVTATGPVTPGAPECVE